MKAKEKNSKNEKMKDIIFIKTITNVNIRGVCSEENVKPQNFYKLKVSAEKLHNIKNNIDKKIKEAYIEYDKDTSTL